MAKRMQRSSDFSIFDLSREQWRMVRDGLGVVTVGVSGGWRMVGVAAMLLDDKSYRKKTIKIVQQFVLLNSDATHPHYGFGS